MAKIQLEDVIAWEDNRGRILCPECFEKEFDGKYPTDWTPVLSNEEYETLYECDNCGERSVN